MFTSVEVMSSISISEIEPKSLNLIRTLSFSAEILAVLLFFLNNLGAYNLLPLQ